MISGEFSTVPLIHLYSGGIKDKTRGGKQRIAPQRHPEQLKRGAQSQTVWSFTIYNLSMVKYLVYFNAEIFSIDPLHVCGNAANLEDKTK